MYLHGTTVLIAWVLQGMVFAVHGVFIFVAIGGCGGGLGVYLKMALGMKGVLKQEQNREVIDFRTR